MICLVFLTILFATAPFFAMQDAISQYILNDVQSEFRAISRTHYNQNIPRSWQHFSSITSDMSFPKIKTYLNLNPHIEFGYYKNHYGGSTKSIARLNECYVETVTSIGTISLGEKRLAFEAGRFFSDASFSLLPRTFGQLGYSSPSNLIRFLYLTHVTLPNSLQQHQYEKGSVIIAIERVNISQFLSIGVHAYFFENISDTYSLSSTYHVSNQQKLSSTVAIQSGPSIGSSPLSSTNKMYYDAGYQYSFNNQSVRFGTRFFEGASDQSLGFFAPYSSGHSWDGILNMYQSNIENGFPNSFRSFFSSYDIKSSTGTTYQLGFYVFRNHLLNQNLGCELNLSIQKAMIKNTIFWSYKIGQFITGSHSELSSQLKMWLDFSIALGNPS